MTVPKEADVLDVRRELHPAADSEGRKEALLAAEAALRIQHMPEMAEELAAAAEKHALDACFTAAAADREVAAQAATRAAIRRHHRNAE